MLIPKIIHQTISSKTSLNPLLKSNINRIQEINQDWECRLYDEVDRRRFIGSAYGAHMLGIYDKIRPEYGAAKADFWRYLVIYQQGGVYLDIKSTTTRPLSSVIGIDDAYLLSHWDNGPTGSYPGWGQWQEHGVENEFQQWHIIAAPRHPYLEAVIKRIQFNIENYNPLRNGVGRIGVLLATGPIPYTRAISPIMDQHCHRLVNIETLGIKYSFIKNSDKKHNELGLSNYRRNKSPLTTKRLSILGVSRLFMHRKLKKLPYNPTEAAAQRGF